MLWKVRDRGVKDDATVFCLSQWEEGVAICCHGEDCGRCKCRGEDLKFTFGQIKLEISVRHSSRDVEEAEKYMRLRFRGEIWVGNIHLGSISI